MDLIHRTVRNFLNRSLIQDKVKAAKKESINADEATCQGILAQIRSSPDKPGYFDVGSGSRLSHYLQTFFDHARNIKDAGCIQPVDISLIESLRLVVTQRQRGNDIVFTRVISPRILTLCTRNPASKSDMSGSGEYNISAAAILWINEMCQFEMHLSFRGYFKYDVFDPIITL